MEWWERAVVPMRRVWFNVAGRLRVRKTGLGRLRQEVNTCEYEDVRVMWEMLSGTETAASPGKRRHVWNGVLGWSPYNMCRGF